jgi:hypothetical protein
MTMSENAMKCSLASVSVDHETAMSVNRVIAMNGNPLRATNGSRKIATCANRAKRVIAGLATETAVIENAVIATVRLAATGVKDAIAGLAPVVVAAERQHRGAKGQQFAKCIRRRVRSRSLRTQLQVRIAQATQNKVPSRPLDGGNHTGR